MYEQDLVCTEKPASILHDVTLPRHKKYYPSPVDWRNEILYFLLVDRFSDGNEHKRPLLDRNNVWRIRGSSWRWDEWAKSGADCWQGGNLRGIKGKLSYLKKLGITTLWLSPVFKQRGHMNSYHGYGIQNFLDVDPHFGTRDDLIDLVSTAHKEGMRIILDIVFQHTGENWDYPGNEKKPPYTEGQYPFGKWLDDNGNYTDVIQSAEDGVWPEELQDPDDYTRAGSGRLDAGDIYDEHAQHKRTDFDTLRDIQLDTPGVMSNIAMCYKYWIALTDCDGFRIDTLKHVSMKEARNFCGSIKEFASNIGKLNFLLIGEIAGGDYAQDRYLDILTLNLNAALDIGEMRPALGSVAKGQLKPSLYFSGFDPFSEGMGSHRNQGNRHVSILDDHDHVCGRKLRFSSGASSDHQVVAGVALQLFSLGIPCIYYGTEQAFAGPELSESRFLPNWGESDRYLREAMFGPEHPLRSGKDGLLNSDDRIDKSMPGFGPFGSAGYHCFDEKHPAYIRISALTALRQQYPVLRDGRQYMRTISKNDNSSTNNPFIESKQGEIIAWSRILDDEEALCIVNGHGNEKRGGNVLVDSSLVSQDKTMTVILNTEQTALQSAYSGKYAVGTSVPVRKTPDGTAYVEIKDLNASEVLVLTNHP